MPPSGSSTRCLDSHYGRSGGPRHVPGGQRQLGPRHHDQPCLQHEIGHSAQKIALIMPLKQVNQRPVRLGHRGSPRSVVEARNSTINRRPRWPPRLHRQRSEKSTTSSDTTRIGSAPPAQVMLLRSTAGRRFLWRVKPLQRRVGGTAAHFAENESRVLRAATVPTDERLKAPLIRSPSCQPSSDACIAARSGAGHQAGLYLFGAVGSSQRFQGDRATRQHCARALALGFMLPKREGHRELQATSRLRLDLGIDGLMADGGGRVIRVHEPKSLMYSGSSVTSSARRRSLPPH